MVNIIVSVEDLETDVHPIVPHRLAASARPSAVVLAPAGRAVEFVTGGRDLLAKILENVADWWLRSPFRNASTQLMELHLQ